MRQALHIFKKDARHLWLELTLTLLLVACFAFIGVGRASWLRQPGQTRTIAWEFVTMLLPLAWWILTARVIHADAIPGDRQFWITRPYRWNSLFGAKVLFLFTFVNLPMLIADAIILRAYGFAVLGEFPGIFWNQVLLTAVYVLPVAAMSAITTGLIPLLLTGLASAFATLAWSMVPYGLSPGAAWFGMDWIRNYIMIGITVLGGVAILAIQYALRQTKASRYVAVSVGALVILSVELAPWSMAFAIQSRLSTQPSAASTFDVRFDSDRKWAARAVPEPDQKVRILLPLRLTGLPPDAEPQAEGLTLTIDAPDGSRWDAHREPRLGFTQSGSLINFRAIVDESFFRKVKDQPVKIRASLYVTLLSRQRKVSLPLNDQPTSVPGVGMCSANSSDGGLMHLVLCSAAFRTPPGVVSVRFINSRLNISQGAFLQRVLNYSPFPSELSVAPVNQYFTFSPKREPLTEISVEIVQPIAHVQRSFEIDNLRLSDFEPPPAKN